MFMFPRSTSLCAPVESRGKTQYLEDALDHFAHHDATKIRLTAHGREMALADALHTLANHFHGSLPHDWREHHTILLERLILRAHIHAHRALVDAAWKQVTAHRDQLCAELAQILRAPHPAQGARWQPLRPTCWHLHEIAQEFPNSSLEETLAILERLMDAQERGLKTAGGGLHEALAAHEDHEREVGHRVPIDPEPRRAGRNTNQHPAVHGA